MWVAIHTAAARESPQDPPVIQIGLLAHLTSIILFICQTSNFSTNSSLNN